MLDFSQAKIVVVGDVMLDRYWHGSATRISPEAPVPVVNMKGTEERIGAAANVAKNIVALGAKASILGVIGDDEAGETLQKEITSAGIQSFLQIKQDASTITKLRVVSRQHQLIRLDFETQNALVLNDASLQAVPWDVCDVLLVSDYGKGNTAEFKRFIIAARARNIPVLVDPKSSDFSHYCGANLVTPNLAEMEAVVGKCATREQLVERSMQVIKQHHIEALLITLGADGMLLVSENYPGIHIPAHAKEVFDVTGAGDTVIAVMALCMASKKSLTEAMHLANCAAAVVVGKMGTATCNLSELIQEASAKTILPPAMTSEEELIPALRLLQSMGKRIVFTNGCFDILHCGHVEYLTEAKAQGDFLVVGLNTDQSVAALKGPTRPINCLADRSIVLAGLKAVDWVVPFSEVSVAKLVARIHPNVLVKGGDYKIDEVVGADHVLAYGGEVKVLKMVDGKSTTNTINAIQELENIEKLQAKIA